jgi:hypothetical protein
LDLAKTRQETLFSDYEMSTGVLISRLTKKVDSATGEIIQTVVVKNVQVNPEINVAGFMPPG